MIEKTTALIDIIFVNNLLFKYISNTTTSVSEHLQFMVVENFKENKINSKRIDTTDMDFQFFIENNDVNLGFETFFFQLFLSTLDRPVPIKQSTRKKQKIKSKLWVKDKLCKAMTMEII